MTRLLSRMQACSNTEIRHVLDSEIAAHGRLTPDLMYECVKRYETYVARGKRLGNTGSHTGPHRPAHSQFPRTTAFAATVEEASEAALEATQGADDKADSEEADSATTEPAGVYLPDFLGQAQDGNWGLNVRMAVAMQEHERQKRKCFICQSTEHLMRDCPDQKKLVSAPTAEGASEKQVGEGGGQVISACTAGPREIEGCTAVVPYLNPDPFRRWIGPKNWGQALVDGKLTTCLLDNGAQLNFVTPAFAQERGLAVHPMSRLSKETGQAIPPIQGIGGVMVEPAGFVIINVRVPCVRGYNEDQIAIVLDDPGMGRCPVILGTPTLYRVMEVIKESEISQLAVPWATSRGSWLMRGIQARPAQIPRVDVANKAIVPASLSEVVRTTNRVAAPPFDHKVIHGLSNITLQGCRMNVMTHGLERRSPQLPLGVEVLSVYATLATGSRRVAVALRNTTRDWLEVPKGTP